MPIRTGRLGLLNLQDEDMTLSPKGGHRILTEAGSCSTRTESNNYTSLQEPQNQQICITMWQNSVHRGLGKEMGVRGIPRFQELLGGWVNCTWCSLRSSAWEQLVMLLCLPPHSGWKMEEFLGNNSSQPHTHTHMDDMVTQLHHVYLTLIQFEPTPHHQPQ